MDLVGIDADSLVKMLKVSFSLENWNAIIEISDKLFEVTAIIHEISENNPSQHSLERDIAYYFGYSFLMKGIAFQRIRKYNEARECINRYANLDWIKNVSEEGCVEVDYYRNISVANMYVIDLLEGKIEVLFNYVELLRNMSKDEIVPGMITVLESAITYGYSVDWVISEFKDQIRAIGTTDTKEDIRFYVDYIFLLAVYYHKQKRYTDTITLVLDILEISSRLEDEVGFRKAAALYEVLREYATTDQREVYRSLMEKILERLWKNEKGFINDNRIIVN